jgi:hypothetical protein
MTVSAFACHVTRGESREPTQSDNTMSAVSPFTAAHRSHVKSLYKRYLTNALSWTIQRDIWRQQAIEIRAEFERNRCDNHFFILTPIYLSASILETFVTLELWLRLWRKRRRNLRDDGILILTFVRNLVSSPLLRTLSFIHVLSAPAMPGGSKWYAILCFIKPVVADTLFSRERNLPVSELNR